MINMGCLTWDEDFTLQRSLSSQGLVSPTSALTLPRLQPGQEGSVDFHFTAPKTGGHYESVWHFWQGNQRFGPPLKFKLEVRPQPDCLVLPGMEMKDYSASQGQEMRSIGISAVSQEMVEMSGGRKHEDLESVKDNEGVKTSGGSEDGFDLLSNEVDTLTLDNEETDEEDFEVIPVPDCFNLEVPFEVVEKELNNNLEETEEEEQEDGELIDVKISPLEEAKKAVQLVQEKLKKDDEEPFDANKTPLEEAKVAVKIVQEKLEKEKEASDILEKISVEAKEAAFVDRLVELGFANRAENIKLLRQNENNIDKVLKKLFSSHSRSCWAEKRH